MADQDMVDKLLEENKSLRKVLQTYENILKLSDTELTNAEEIIRMFENMMEYTRLEIRGLKETIAAKERVSEYSDMEREDSMKKISELIELNKKLKEERAVINN
jgi:predicted naringenin-chalcone synthase